MSDHAPLHLPRTPAAPPARLPLGRGSQLAPGAALSARLRPRSARQPCPTPCTLNCTRVQMQQHAVVSIEALRAGRVWTAATAAFSHVDLWHLVRGSS